MITILTFIIHPKCFSVCRSNPPANSLYLTTYLAVLNHVAQWQLCKLIATKESVYITKRLVWNTNMAGVMTSCAKKLHCWPNLEDVYRFSLGTWGVREIVDDYLLRRDVLTLFSFRSLQLHRLFFVGCPSLLKVKSNLWYFIFFILFCVYLYSKGFAQNIAKPIQYQVKPFHCRLSVLRNLIYPVSIINKKKLYQETLFLKLTNWRYLNQNYFNFSRCKWK